MVLQEGQSGNPNGCPCGSRHKATLLAQALIDGQAEKLARKAVEQALAGDPAALRLCIERLVPRSKDRPVAIDLREASGSQSAYDAVVASVSAGEMTPSEGETLARIFELRRRAGELDDMETRIAALEAKQ